MSLLTSAPEASWRRVFDPRTLFCLICTIVSNKTGIFDEYQNTNQVLAARSFLVAGFDTYVIPRSFFVRHAGWAEALTALAVGVRLVYSTSVHHALQLQHFNFFSLRVEFLLKTDGGYPKFVWAWGEKPDMFGYLLGNVWILRTPGVPPNLKGDTVRSRWW